MATPSQFDAAADDYPAYPHEIPLRDHMELHSLRAAAGDVRGLDTMDLGCGAGRYAQFLARWGARSVVGVDGSVKMLEQARATEAADPLGITYRTADATTDHLTDLADSTDLVLSCYALPYATTASALTGMFTTARTVLRPGGRFIAATLNPGYADESRHPGHYRGYDMRLTAATYPPADGTPIGFVVGFGDPAIPPLDVTATWWSGAAYEQAARAAGFTTVAWRHFTVSDIGRQRYGAEFWAPYLEHPHAVIIEVA